MLEDIPRGLGGALGKQQCLIDYCCISTSHGELFGGTRILTELHLSTGICK